MTFSGTTAFVTGATGFLGGVVARKLADAGAQVRALARSPEKAASLRDVPGVEVVAGDVTRPEDMRLWVEGCDYVFHAAAAFGSWQQQQAVNVEGTRNIMYAATSGQRVVFVSSIAVYGYSRTGTITEDDGPSPTAHDAYSVTKAEAEQVVQDIASENNISYAIIRPGMIYGPHGTQWTDTMFRLARRRPVFWLGNGSGSAFPIYMDDVADLMLLLATHPAAHNEVFNAVHPTPVTWRDFLLGYARLAGHQSWLSIPPKPVVALAKLAAAVVPTGNRLKAGPEAAGSLLNQRRIDMSKAQNRLHWQPVVDLDTGLEKCVPYLKQKGLLR
ncbi:MAG: hypothetical protein CL610_04305 [Anaerolineaceae bacterium]|nr:hypothetical protein [Anaerolineaceae bacterium]